MNGWLLAAIVGLAVLVWYLTTHDATPRPTEEVRSAATAAPKIPPIRLPVSRRQAALTVHHAEPILGSLFSQELETLPEGVTRPEFERMVEEYTNKYLTVKEVKVPRTLTYNAEKYQAEQEAVRQTQREMVLANRPDREQLGTVGQRTVSVAQLGATPASFMRKRK